MGQYHLYEKNMLGLVQAMLDVFCGEALVSLEGDLHRVHTTLAGIADVLDEPVPPLRRLDRFPVHDFAIIPLTWDTLFVIKHEVLPNVGLGTHVRHVQIAKEGLVHFGAYRLNYWAPWMPAIFVCSDVVPESVLKEFVSRRLLRDYEWIDYPT